MLCYFAGSPNTLRYSLCPAKHRPLNNRMANSCSRHHVLIIGALSFLGARAAAHLVGSGWNVLGASHDSDITTDELVWYRKEQLINTGVHVQLLNFSDQTQVVQLLTEHRPAHLLYIPPGIDRHKDYYPDYVMWTRYLKEFVVLLETLKTISPCTRLVLASLSRPPSPGHVTSHDSHMTALQAWVKSYELTVSTYHHLYGLPITILRTGGVYGPWSDTALELHSSGEHTHMCWYIGDVVKAFQSVLQLETDCDVLDLGDCQATNHVNQYTWNLLNITEVHSSEAGNRKTLSWARSYLQQKAMVKGLDVMFTSYFTTTEDSQRNRKKASNRFEYMMEWFLTVRKLNLKAVIFHDGLDAKFRHRVIQHYRGISFQYVPSLQNRSTNDARFYSYLTYLENHPEISRLFLTDISDVRFQMNPFELTSVLGDWLYIGTDIDIFPSMKTMPWIHERLPNCFGNYSAVKGDLRSVMELDTVYNAGVIGGTRHTVLAALHRIVEYLDATPPHLNCNMPAVNYAIHRHFYDSVFTGFPLTSRFLRRQTAPKGVYIIHK